MNHLLTIRGTDKMLTLPRARIRCFCHTFIVAMLWHSSPRELCGSCAPERFVPTAQLRRSFGRLFEQTDGDLLNDLGINCISQCFMGARARYWQMLQLIQALQTRALAGRHVALFPSNDWNLGCGKGYQ
jgi:hypothetical protein